MEIDIKPILEKIHSVLGRPIAFLDTETTGLDIAKDDIIQMYVARYDENGFSEVNKYFKTKRNISEGAFEKHGISKEFLEDKPHFSEDANEVWKLFEGDVILCGYNHIKFDIPIIIENLLRANVSEAVTLLKKDVIDVLDVYRKLFPNDLEAVFQRLTGKVLENAHEAGTDVFATAVVLAVLMKDNEIVPEKSEKIDVDGFFKMVDGSLAFAKGKHKDSIIKEMNPDEAIGYLNWLINNDGITSHTKFIAKTIKSKLVVKLEA